MTIVPRDERGKVDSRALLRRLVLAAVAIPIAYAMGSYVYEHFILSDEGKIRRMVREMARGLEEKDARAVCDRISPRYRVDTGLGRDLDRETLRAFLVQRFLALGPRRFVVFLGPIDVDLADDRQSAEAFFLASVIEGADAERTYLPADGEAYDVHLVAVKEDGEWRVLSHEVQYARAGAPEELFRP